MSVRLLSRQDVEVWVPEPASSKCAGFVAKLSTAIDRAMVSLVKMRSMTKNATHQGYQNEYERFSLWGQGLSLVDGDLDEVLNHCQELRVRVLSLLLRLGNVVLQGLTRDQRPLSLPLNEQCDDLRALLDVTDTILQELEPEQSIRTYTPSESDGSEYEMVDNLEEVSMYVDCLLDMSPSLDNPAMDIVMEGSEMPQKQAQESFNVRSEEALLYCRKVRDRFKHLPKYLVERLAEANVLRATTLREMRSRPTKDDPQIDDEISENLFSTTDHPVTATTKSTAPSSSIFSSVMSLKSPFAGYVSAAEFDDNVSEVTFAPVSTTASAISLGRPRVPEIPDIHEESFDCPICFSQVTDVKTRKEWKKHVFNDLKPYICVIEGCDDAGALYGHSGTWIQHVASHWGSIFRTSECPFCSAIYEKGGIVYFRHLSTHLREVSLSVLPQPGHDDEGSNTNDSDLPSSVPNSHKVYSRADPIEYPLTGEKQAESDQPQPPLSPALFVTPRDLGTEAAPGQNTDASTSSENRTPIPGREDLENPAALSAAIIRSLWKPKPDLDSIIDRLLAVRGRRPTPVQLSESEIQYLCIEASEKFLSQPTLLEPKIPITVHGDIHGQYSDLLKGFELTAFPPDTNHLFLGNYVDYGRYSIEVMCLILAYKIKYPDSFFVLRGNHECASISRVNGFYSECTRRYNKTLWKDFVGVFNCMPLAAILAGKVFCVHGGLSPDLSDMDQIRDIQRPAEVPDEGLMCDLLWSDPDKDITGWGGNDRGVSFTFGPDVVSRFSIRHDFDLIIRGHQLVKEGYEYFAKQQLVTIWGAPCYKTEHDNQAASLTIDDDLAYSFQIIAPPESHRYRARVQPTSFRGP